MDEVSDRGPGVIKMDPYDVIIMPWITEKTLEARRIADPEGGHRENNTI